MNSPAKTFAVVAGIGGVLAGAAFFALTVVVPFLQPATTTSCASMADEAAELDPDKAGTPTDLIISIVGSGSDVAAEAGDLVRAEGAVTDEPGRGQLVNVQLRLGDREYVPQEDANCFSTDLYLAAAEADLSAYAAAPSSAGESLLNRQVLDKANALAEIVQAAVLAAPPPETPPSAYATWQAVVNVPADRRAVVLDTFDTAADTCLLIEGADLLDLDAVTGQVQACLAVDRGGIETPPATTVTLIAATAVGLDANQLKAQRNVIAALCTTATCT